MCNISNENLRLQLELQSAGPSTPSIITDEQGNIIDRRDSSSEPIQFVFEEIHWTSEISQEEAARRMEVTFYPFKKVIHYIRISWWLCYYSVGVTLCSFPGVLPAFFRGFRASRSRAKAGALYSAVGSFRWPVLLRWDHYPAADPTEPNAPLFNVMLQECITVIKFQLLGF